MSFVKFDKNYVIIKPILKDFSKNLKTHFVKVEPDKSITHRALILAAMAQGTSIIYNPSLGLDCLNTLNIISKLGVHFKIKKHKLHNDIINVIYITSKGIKNWQLKTKVLNFQNSGTGARLMIPLLSTVSDVNCLCVGDTSLSQRPMDRVINPLIKIGAKIKATKNKFLPISIKGLNLAQSINYLYDIPSSQVKSAIILASLNIDASSYIRLPKGSRDHTEYILKYKLHAPIRVEHKNYYEHIYIDGKWIPSSFEGSVPSDLSASAYIFALGAILKKANIRIPNLSSNLTRLGFIDTLAQMGVKFEFSTPYDDNDSYNWLEHDVCDISMYPTPELTAIKVNSQKVPSLIDEIPILAVVCAFAQGVSQIEGVSELTHKETDRISQTLALLQSAGVQAWYENNSLYIVGQNNPKITPFIFDSKGDHRMAMCASILALFASGQSKIINYKCTAVSWPNFFNCLVNLLK